MLKRVITAIIVLSLVATIGCEEIAELTGTSSSATPEIVRQAELGSEWQMNQMKMDIEAGEELSILLKLTDGDRVDGYFYLEKGEDIAFNITGNSLIYKSEDEGSTASGGVASDRFSFVADRAEGTTYTLTFDNKNGSAANTTKATVFLEVIYPVTGSIFVPVGTK
jgi:hypothetical protein